MQEREPQLHTLANSVKRIIRDAFVALVFVTVTASIWQPGVLATLTGLFTSTFMSFVQADLGTIDPNGNGTGASTAVTCGAGGRYDCLDDGVATTSAPASGSDYTEFLLGDRDFYDLETIGDVATVSEIRVYLYHVQTSSNLRFDVSLFDTNEVTQYGGVVTLTTRTSSQWDVATFSGLSLSQAQLDDLNVSLLCERAAGSKPRECRAFAMYVEVEYAPQIEVQVGSTGSQQNFDVGSTNQHVGGAFVIEGLAGTRNVTSVTIAENGTVDAQNNIDNIELYYDLDTTLPYDCASESYAGTETQFGSTDTDGFSGANGDSVFTDSVSISTTQSLCLYPVLDVSSSAVAAETIELEITNPDTDVVASGAPDIEPLTAVSLAGTTIIQAQERTQAGYHWRNDDGSETAATSAAGAENTVLGALGVGSSKRLRVAVSNEGNRTSDATQYRIEYGQKTTTCGDISTWIDVGAGGGDFDMSATANLSDGSNTTNVTTGGVTDPAGKTFLSTNGGQRDTTSQTGSITLTSSQFTELEYSIVATVSATAGFTYCFRVSNAGSDLEVYDQYPEATILADVTVSSLGSQDTTVTIPTLATESGVTFSIVDNITGDTTVQSITLTAAGTVDTTNDIDNIELYYDLDTSAPYNCASESYGGGESQFGSTDTDGFDGSGLSTFNGSQIVNPTQTMCIYVVYDATSAITDAETLNILIDDASVDVTINAGTVAPVANVDPTGLTTFIETIVTQTHYHWRNDDGSETGASSATDGNEDTKLEELRRLVPKRLRFGVANQGGLSASSAQFRLEYALQTSVCSAASGWADVGAAAGAFDMVNSVNFTDGADTTDIATSSGGVTNEEPTFIANNNALKDTSSQTSGIVLTGNSFVELEYAIQATASSTEGATYCFRVTDAGTELDNYSSYGEVSIKPATDFFIQRGRSTVTGTSLTLTAGTDYVAPAAAANAFIRITNTLNTGAGGGTLGNADDVTAYISNGSNITSNIVISRAAGATGNTVVSWEIIEYVGAAGGDNELVVRQQQPLTYGSGNTTVTSPTVSGIVDDSDVVVFITGQLNPSTVTDYFLGISTAAWNSGADTTTFTRGASGNASIVSYAVVEFVGDNWRIQRSEHTYSSAGVTETESITAVNSLSKAFVHSQKRMGTGLSNHSDFGHNVWLSGLGQVSFEIDNGAATAGSHTSVAWVIENIQSVGQVVDVTRSNGTQSTGGNPTITNVNIGKTLEDLTIASIFMNNFGDENGGGSGQNSFPEPLMAARLISTTQYELYIANADDSRTWRAEVVEWPTASRDISQNYYRFYVDNNSIDVTDPWPAGATDLGENTEITAFDSPLSNGSTTRIRMSLAISAASMDAGVDSFKLQYGEQVTTCSALGEGDWNDVGDTASTTALWRGANGTPVDGTAISTDPPAGGALKLSVSDIAGTYEEDGLSATTPYEVQPNEDIEYDWLIEHNGAKDKTVYCFRMTESNGTIFDDYFFFPTLRTAGYQPLINNWRWYDDAASVTPSSAFAAENVTPSNIDNQEDLKLRVVLEESSGAPGIDTKFAVQFSEFADFSESVTTLTSTTSCSGNSLWCYFDGGGNDNEQITTSLITGADTCTGGAGSGCGTRNESTSTSTATYDQPALSSAEFEFSLKNDGARVNTVYYFRLYDLQADEVVELDSGASYPSILTAGARAELTVTGVAAGTSVAGVVTDASSTATGVSFSDFDFGVSNEVAQELTVDTNATEGFQVLMFVDQQLTNDNGDTIPPVSSSNASPAAWDSACSALETGCSGYHTTDATLSGDTGRFAPTDSYAAFSTTTQEILYSPIPVADTQNLVYRIEVTEFQTASSYETQVTYILVPVH